MHAAVVTSFDQPPSYQRYANPIPRPPDELLVNVVAAGLHPRVRSQADGTHYTSSAELPLVPGIDGVGRASDGTLRYFVLPDTTMGSMAEQTVIDRRRSIVLPLDADPVAIAAAMNPAMSSWIALRRRIAIRPGQRVLVLGATGNAGQLAVQVAKHLGASFVAAAGRDTARLADLAEVGADSTHLLGGDPSELARQLGAVTPDLDIVLDYLWGQPAVDVLHAIATARPDPSRPLTWVQIGSVAGATAAIPSAALRAFRLEVVGSGQGSVPTSDIIAELPALAAEITKGTFRVNPRPVALTDIATAWSDARSRERIVITP